MAGSESFRLVPEVVILAIFVHKDHVPCLICNMCKKRSEDYSGPTRTGGQFPLVFLKLSATCATTKSEDYSGPTRTEGPFSLVTSNYL
jgi:hypothetical protein